VSNEHSVESRARDRRVPRRGHARLRIKLAAWQDAALELLVVGVILAMMLILSLR
jgi:hypothetical protein